MAKSKAAKAQTGDVIADVPVSAVPYTVVARRYRPQQFADLIGQEHVSQALINAITSGRIAHAYLFTGARGVGKTSTARILAKALNCERGPTGTPCDACEICKSIADGNDVDVIEIDGASNNKVEEARELRSNVGFRPTRARFKIYIIDEVHMLSVSAFNALLKTMEEPPAHVKFILATTEVQKIPITILSRCQRFNFNIVGPVKILETLIHIAKKEGLAAEPLALKIIARRANGSMRDSQTLLEQLLAACEGELTVAKVHDLFGTSTEEQVTKLATAILNGDVKTSLELVSHAAEQGLQLGELLDQLIEYWRGLMLACLGAGDAGSVDDTIREAAKACSVESILAGVELLAATKAKLRGSSHTQLLIEVAVVRLARLGDLLSVAQLAQWVQGNAPAGIGPTVRALPTVAVDKKKMAIAPDVPRNGEHLAPHKVQERPFPELWDAVLQQLGTFLREYLRFAENPPAKIGPNALAIRYSWEYTSACELVKSERNQEVIRKALAHETGRDWLVRVELIPQSEQTEIDVASRTSSPAAHSKLARNAILALPLFKAAAEKLGAQLMRMDDGYDPVSRRPVPVILPSEVEEADEDLDATTPMEEVL